ncbi:MAG: flavin reductase [Melioribacteraceae bacterium]|nr:flavin reductase [Melioribacteraceae bacterium]MCF8354751.1 flavin reductase [Melioribacteraceae bacterium]MCF8393227.1 flavin reductase [Melioribacteraceae bacterium]MCF8417528.1 flavin reductase [Melioribacteraceae bacterium]
MKKIDVEKFVVRPHYLWNNEWMLLTSGDINEKFNTMTVAWGSIGTMWNKPFVQVVVRPTRYTFEFTEKNDSFTLTAFPEKYKSALKLLGTKSGRDVDKIREAGLSPIKSQIVSAPTFYEAELSIECIKIYWDDFKPENFLKSWIDKNYPIKDYHRVYFGEIVHIRGEEKFQNF